MGYSTLWKQQKKNARASNKHMYIIGVLGIKKCSKKDYSPLGCDSVLSGTTWLMLQSGFLENQIQSHATVKNSKTRTNVIRALDLYIAHNEPSGASKCGEFLTGWEPISLSRKTAP